ncbi:MAG: sulfotransferase [Actinomycetota bacterium]|nr:sulfotransferase [Actinomycetota bacterium]
MTSTDNEGARREPPGPPILVTGSHRSGTTWVGRMLDLSGDTGYIHEPFLPTRSPGWIPRPLPHWFMYITEDNEDEYLGAVEGLVRFRYPLGKSLKGVRDLRHLGLQAVEMTNSIRYRRRRKRALIKDPLALFSSEWLARRFGMEVVVMIRSPLAFVSSIKRLNWGFDYERHWLAQELLMRDLLGHRAEEFRDYEGEIDLVGEGIVMWNAIYDVVARFRERHPEWHYVIYEELAKDPVPGFRSLYSALDLPWNEAVREGIAAHSRSDNPKEVPVGDLHAVRRDSAAAAESWRTRLSSEEIERVSAETAEVASLFYNESPGSSAAASQQRASDETDLLDPQ